MSGAIQQQGPLTPGHVLIAYAGDAATDGGGAGAGNVSELGITNEGGLALGINSGTVAGKYTQLGFSVSEGSATIEVQSFNGAQAATLFIDINGVAYPFPGTGNGDVVGPGLVVAGDLVAFAGTTGTLIRDSGIPAARIVQGPSSSVAGDLPIFSGTGGSIVSDSAIPSVGLILSVPTIAALRAVTAMTLPVIQCIVAGYHTGADGGEGTFWYNAADTTSADNAGTIIVDASGRRWYRETLSQPMSVNWFGAVGDGTTDDSAAVLAAVAAVVALGGGKVTFSAKRYQLGTTTLAVTTSSVEFQGAGEFATVLLFTGANDIFTFVGPSYDSRITGNAVRDLSITCTDKTGGRAFFLQYCGNAMIERVYVNYSWDGLDDLSCNTVTCRDLTFKGMVGGLNTRGIYFRAPADGSADNIELNLDNVLVNCLWSGADGIVWDGPAYTLNAYNTTMLDVRIGLYVLNSASSGAFYPEFLEATTFTVDGASAYSAFIGGGANMRFNGCNLQNTSGEAGQGGADQQAVVILADAAGSETHEVYFSNCTIGLSGQSAVYTEGKNVAFSQCRFGAGTTTPANTHPAVQVANGAADTRISDCSNWYFGNPNNWSYGVQMDAGSTATLVIGGNFNAGSMSGSFLNNSGDTNTFASDFVGAPTGEAGPVMTTPNYIAAPATPGVGECYFNTTTRKGQMWDGTAWNDLW
jgi:hypothetical protein